MGEVQNQDQRSRYVQGPHSITEVGQLFALQMGQGLTFSPDTRQRVIENYLENPKCQENRPVILFWNAVLQEQLIQMFNEVHPGFACLWQGNLSVVKFRTNPHVVHQKREPYYHTNDTGGPTKLVFDFIRLQPFTLRQKINRLLRFLFLSLHLALLSVIITHNDGNLRELYDPMVGIYAYIFMYIYEENKPPLYWGKQAVMWFFLEDI